MDDGNYPFWSTLGNIMIYMYAQHSANPLSCTDLNADSYIDIDGRNTRGYTSIAIVQQSHN